MFLMIGMLFSVAALGDCSFLELDNRLFFPSDMDDNDDTSGTKKGGNYLPIEVTQTQFVGFLTWKNLDGYVIILLSFYFASILFYFIMCYAT